MYSDDLQGLLWGLLRGQEQQVDVAERRKHAAPVAAGRGDREMLGPAEPCVGDGVLIERGDQPVGQLAEQARGLQPADLVLLEGVLHMLLHPGLVASEHAERRFARNRAALLGERGKSVGEDGGGCLGGFRQGHWGQHLRNRS